MLWEFEAHSGFRIFYFSEVMIFVLELKREIITYLFIFMIFEADKKIFPKNFSSNSKTLMTWIV